jgi:phage-related protein
MTKWAFLLCLAILSVSCNSLLKSKPSGLLSESQMTDILVDMNLTEASVRAANDSISRLNDTTDLRIRFAEVFRKHDVTPDEFNISLNYYLEQIDELDKIYSEVISRLSLQEANLQQMANKKPYAFVKGGNKGIDSTAMKNPWYRTLNFTDQPWQSQYFDPLVFRNK